MKQTNSTINTDSSVQHAQDAVDRSLAKFESALESLAGKVEQTSHRVEHVGELAMRSKDELAHLKDSFQHAVDPFVPYFRQSKEVKDKAVSQFQQNPKSFIFAILGIAGALWYMSRSQSRSSISSQNWNSPVVS